MLNDELLNTIKDLQSKYETLEIKFNKLEQEINSGYNKKRKDLVDRFDNITKDINYSDFIDKIEINNEHLQLYFDLTYDDAFVKTIERVVSFMSAEEIPFIMSDKKLMYFENNKWEIWNKTEIENFIYKIHHKIIQQILFWQQEHVEELEHKETSQQWFHGLLRKVTNRKSSSTDLIKRRLISIFNIKNIE